MKLKVLFTILITSIALLASPTAKEYGVVLNLSGKQRMLSQKMSKEVVLIALEENKAENLKNLKSTVALFDKTLIGLKDGDASLKLPPTTEGRILRQLKKTDLIWKDMHSAVKNVISNGKASKSDVAKVAELSLPLLGNMNKCVKLYEKDASKAGLASNPGLAVTINLSGKQRMLTQKMSKEFFLIAYGHDAENNRLSLLDTYSLFEKTLAGLLDGDTDLDLPGTKRKHIRDQLAKVKALWVTFQPKIAKAAKTNSSSTKSEITAIATQNVPLLGAMNSAVKMYEIESSIIK